jgi:hypothetical protein
MRSTLGPSQYTPPLGKVQRSARCSRSRRARTGEEGLVGVTAGKEACIAFVSVGYDQVTFP